MKPVKLCVPVRSKVFVVRFFKVKVARCIKSSCSKISCFWFTEIFMLEEIKFIKKLGLSILLMATLASLGRSGEFLIGHAFVRIIIIINEFDLPAEKLEDGGRFLIISVSKIDDRELFVHRVRKIEESLSFFCFLLWLS